MKKFKSTNVLTWLLPMPLLLIFGSIYFTLFIAKENSTIIVGMFFVIVSMVFLGLFLLYYRRIKEEESILNALLERTELFRVYKKILGQSDTLKNKSKKDIYHYLESVLEGYYANEKKIEKVTKENEQFLINLSHEIRTPLQGIIGYTQLLNETSLEEDQRDCVSHIKESSEALLTATSHVLNLSKVDEEVMSLKNISFDIFEKVESVIEDFARKAEQKNITLGIYTDPALNRYWIGDSEKITRILTNLIDNSIQFSPIGGMLSVFVRSVELDGNIQSINFSIQDNRMGIDKNMQKIIFGSFIQSDIIVGRERRNDDNGLVTTSKMVELLGGKLTIESEGESGVTFSFTLSLQKDKNHKIKKITDLKSLKVGLALPDRSVYRDIDMFLEEYIRTFNAEFSIYYYDDLFGAKGYKVILPDVLIFDHRYARRKGYLNILQSLDCHKVLVTTHELKGQINQYIHKFDSIVFSPMTYDKTSEVLEKFHRDESEFWVHNVETSKLEFENTNVLVVEDNSVNQKLIKTLLEKFKLNVTLASNGQEAFYLRQEKKYDLIFMDIEMPVMDGVEATKKILQYEVQNSLSHVPIVALTANALIGDQEKYIKAGIDYYLSKPIRLQKLKYILELYIANKS